jgi:hypothetical protein
MTCVIIITSVMTGGADCHAIRNREIRMQQQELTIPFGKNKGKSLKDADEKDLSYLADRIGLDLAAETIEQRFVANNRKLHAGIVAELGKRGIQWEPPDPKEIAAHKKASAEKAGAKPQQQPQSIARAGVHRESNGSTALARAAEMAVVGAFHDAGAATKALLEAQNFYHLVTPATVVGSLLEGCEVYTSLVVIDPYGTEVYNITGNRKNPLDDDSVGIDRVALAKIASAAGLTWVRSHRTDDGSDPHYCSWEAVGSYRLFDGTERQVPGNVEIDTRPGGAAYEEIMSKGTERGRDPAKQLLELRKFLSRHAESKAMNRAIAAIGVKRSYKRFELKKAFLVARVAFTGRTDDPEGRKLFREKIADKFLGSSNSLYGDAPRALPPPPVGDRHYDDEPHAPPPAGAMHVPQAIETNGKPPSEPKASPPPAQDADGYGYDENGDY